MLNSFRRIWADLSLSAKGVGVVMVPLLIFTVAGLFSGYMLKRAQEVERLVDEALEVQLSLEHTHTLVLEASAGVRGYLLTGQPELLSRYVEIKDILPEALRGVAALLASEPRQLEQFTQVQKQIEQEFVALSTLLDEAPVRGERAPPGFDALVVSSQALLATLGSQFEALQTEQQRIVTARGVQRSRMMRLYYLTLISSLLLGVAGGGLGMHLFALGITRRVRELSENAESLARGRVAPYATTSNDEIGNLSAALDRAGQLLITRGAELHQANDAISLKFDELTRRHHQIVLLNQLAAGLQHCQTPPETFDVLVEKVRALCPDAPGSLYLFDTDKGNYYRVSSWGDPASEAVFSPRACFVPERGQYYLYGLPPTQGNTPAYCAHIGAPPAMSLCYSLVVQDKPLGILHLQGDAPLTDDVRGILGAMADRFALALVNLRLRDTLLQQAIRDALTGLYNRRYLEETLERELQRAKRSGLPLSVLIADIDYFKQFNDVHGHKAGDEVLKVFGRLLAATFRAQDIPCRYGGEEFIVVLPETDLPTSRRRAETLVEQVRSLEVPLANVSEGLSISVGIAVYPEHGHSAQDLINCADEAMYKAKHRGRDQAVTAQSVPPNTASDLN